jgi:hypothetical protein
MPGRRTDFEAVRKLALELPGVEESRMWGAPAFKTGGKMFACVPTHKSAEPGSFAVRIDFDRRAELLAEAPEAYYLTDHYVNYPIVLVRLRCVSSDAMRDLLAGARRFVSAGSAGRRAPRRRTSPPS